MGYTDEKALALALTHLTIPLNHSTTDRKDFFFLLSPRAFTSSCLRDRAYRISSHRYTHTQTHIHTYTHTHYTYIYIRARATRIYSARDCFSQ